MRLSSSSMTPISTRRSRARSSPIPQHGPDLRSAPTGSHDDFVIKLAAAVAKMKVGNGVDSGIVQGPLINEKAVEKVERHVAGAVAKGAKVLIGGRRHVLGARFSSRQCCRCDGEDAGFGLLARVYWFSSEDEVVATQGSEPSFPHCRRVGMRHDRRQFRPPSPKSLPSPASRGVRRDQIHAYGRAWRRPGVNQLCSRLTAGLWPFWKLYVPTSMASLAPRDGW